MTTLTPIDTQVDLTINKLTEDVFNDLSAQDRLDENQLYVVTEDQYMVTGGTSKVVMRDWYSEPPPMLTFTAEEANSTVGMYKEGNPPDVSLEYSVDGGATWQDFTVGTTTVTLTGIGDQMMMRAKTTNATFATDTSNENRFSMTGKIAASGSIMYLLRNDGDSDTVPDYGFPHLFYPNCAALTSPPDIPATKLGRNCYEGTFCGTSISAIEIPDAELNVQCYYWMFASCNQLHEIKIHYTGNFQGDGVPYEAFSYWVYNIPDSGIFYYNGSDTSQSESAIPYGWTVQTF